MSTTILILLHIAVLAYALVAGVFLAFSDFIMRSLAITSGSGGVEAMQAINREVFRWIFMTLFLGMAAGSAAIAASQGHALRLGSRQAQLHGTHCAAVLVAQPG